MPSLGGPDYRQFHRRPAPPACAGAERPTGHPDPQCDPGQGLPGEARFPHFPYHRSIVDDISDGKLVLYDSHPEAALDLLDAVS